MYAKQSFSKAGEVAWFYHDNQRVVYTREEITKHQATATTIDKEKIDRKWPASSGRHFCVLLKRYILFGDVPTCYAQ